jgi:exosome complex RNA-binding protein Csl4
MATLTFISPKSFFIKIADIFQKREGAAPSNSYQKRTDSALKTEEARSQNSYRSKLNISLEDLKIISTSLLHYRRNLNKIGDTARAEVVARIDKQFYELITELENQALRQEVEQEEEV